MRLIPVSRNTLPQPAPQRRRVLGDPPAAPQFEYFDFSVTSSLLSASAMSVAGFAQFVDTFQGSATFFLLDILFTDPTPTLSTSDYSYVEGFGLRFGFGAANLSNSFSGSVSSMAAAATMNYATSSSVCIAPGLSECPLNGLLPQFTGPFGVSTFLQLGPVIGQYLQWIASPANRGSIQPEVVGMYFASADNVVQNAATSFGVARRALKDGQALNDLYGSLAGLSAGLPAGAEFEDVVFQAAYTSLLGVSMTADTSPSKSQKSVASALDGCGP